jgi:putative transposase
MPHSLVCNWQHIVFSTKGRQPWLIPELQVKLWPFLTGTADRLGIHPAAINGVPDHIHLLLGISGSLAISTAVQKLKANSSRWLKERCRQFSWQEGFSSFSVSASNLPAVVDYINRQQEHHKKRNFQEELVTLLKKHNVVYDPRYILG